MSEKELYEILDEIVDLDEYEKARLCLGLLLLYIPIILSRCCGNERKKETT